ncbi:MAG: VWA domain-containing protein, partial [Bryobacteraceae bacterium]
LAQQPITTFRVETRIVVLHVTVTGPDGVPVPNLPREAFEVYENGVRQEIKTFRFEDVPVSLGLVIDTSASMRDKGERVAAAALALVKASKPDDEVFLVTFADSPSLEVDFTGDLRALQQGLARIRYSGGTAMRDALAVALDHVKDRRQKDKRILLVITDGHDNASVESLDRLIRSAQQSEVLVYAIGILGDEAPSLAAQARRALDALARATGGSALYPSQLAGIERFAPAIAREIRSQYILAYTPSETEPDGAFRQIRVLANSPGAVVRTRSGYYPASP